MSASRRQGTDYPLFLGGATGSEKGNHLSEGNSKAPPTAAFSGRGDSFYKRSVQKLKMELRQGGVLTGSCLAYWLPIREAMLDV